MEVTTPETLRRLLAEAQLRCESANVPLFQSLYAQAERARRPEQEAAAALERAMAGTLDGLCERVRQFSDEAVLAAYPACASREAQLQTCASWLAEARCKGPGGFEFASAHPQLCAVAAKNALLAPER
jgi:hypothetical protein